MRRTGKGLAAQLHAAPVGRRLARRGLRPHSRLPRGSVGVRRTFQRDGSSETELVNRLKFALWIITFSMAINVPADAKELEFRGWPEGDKETGFAIAANKQKDAILILNEKGPYVVLIP